MPSSYISASYRMQIHKIFTTGPREYSFSSEHTAISVRREIYRERARLKRESPDSLVCLNAQNLLFRISDNKIIVSQKSDHPSLAQAITNATS